MKKNAKNFDKVAFALLTLVLGVLGFVSWKIYESNNKPESHTTTTIKPILYTDTADRFSFVYPGNWEIDWPENGGVDGSPANPTAVKTKLSRPIVIKPSAGQYRNNVTVTPGCSTTTISETKARNDQFHTQENLTINGYTAFYDKLDFKGDAESYLHHTYIILGNSDCVEIAFRENWHHDMSDTNFDDSENMPEFKSIVESIKFLN